MKYKIHKPAENYIYMDFGNMIDERVNRYVICLFNAIDHEAVIEMIPSYSGLLIEFNPLKASHTDISRYIKKLEVKEETGHAKLHVIPVRYDGPDLQHVADYNGLTSLKVIEIHSSRDYRVYMMGFLPGFCYLGGMDDSIACPRKDKPRLRIDAGSVGIAGNQTGIYPQDSPGGWQIIGRTDFSLYDRNNENPFPVKAGDTIRFVPAEG